MLNFVRQSLKLKIFSGFAFIFLSVIVFGLTVAGSLGRVVIDFEHAQAYTLSKIVPLASLQAKLLAAAMPANDYLITGEKIERAHFAHLEFDIDSDFATLKSDPTNADIRPRLLSSERLWNTARAAGLHLLNTRYQYGDRIAASKMERFDRLIEEATGHLKKAQIMEIEHVGGQLATVQRERWRANLLIAIIWVLTPIVSLIAALWLSRNVLTPIEALHKGALRFAQGDLDYEMSVDSGDEFEALSDEFNLMAKRLKKSRDILHRLAIRDGLTGLYNHREFHRLLRQEIERAKRSQDSLSLLMIDIDFFKDFNDTYGHKQGDKALKLIARLIRTQIRSIDLSARYGGEEFSVILPDANSAEAATIAERIRASVTTEPLIVGGEVVQLSVSIGVSELSLKAKDASGLVEAADTALYAAKRGGRDQVAFASS